MSFRRLTVSLFALAVAAGASLAVVDSAAAQAPAQPGAEAAAPDAAAPKPRARKARKAAPKRAPRGEAVPRNGAIVVTNRRDANLVELTATPQDGRPAITIARDVPAGGRASGKLPPKAGCVFSLSGTFDDESTMEATNLNLCKDGRINLVE
jgi:hypothetical protein